MSAIHKEIVVLLLGESGVGKSTFINALANYYTYADFETAGKSAFEFRIPVYFTLTGENLYQVTYKLGTDMNEVQEPGKAATKHAKSHLIRVNEEISLRVIDTPGFCNPNGTTFAILFIRICSNFL